jgi:hypothetical protein
MSFMGGVSRSVSDIRNGRKIGNTGLFLISETATRRSAMERSRTGRRPKGPRKAKVVRFPTAIHDLLEVAVPYGRQNEFIVAAVAEKLGLSGYQEVADEQQLAA